MHTHTQRYTQTHIQIHTHTDTHRHTHRDTHTYRERDTHRHMYRYTQSYLKFKAPLNFSCFISQHRGKDFCGVPRSDKKKQDFLHPFSKSFINQTRLNSNKEERMSVNTPGQNLVTLRCLLF